jgi:hypothetical protein
MWNGVNAVLRDVARSGGVRVRHETSTGFAALLSAEGTSPADVESRAGLFGPFSPQCQFSSAFYAPGHTAVVLSIQGDVCVPMLRHRESGALLHPYNCMAWPLADLEWLQRNCVPLQRCSAEDSMQHLLGVIERFRQVNDAPILVSNLSTVTPGETVHAYLGIDESYAQRVRRFNVALVDAAMQVDFSIVDVERIVATGGARTLLTDAIHLSAEGCRAVAGEVVRILDDYGVLPEAACASPS